METAVTRCLGLVAGAMGVAVLVHVGCASGSAPDQVRSERAEAPTGWPDDATVSSPWTAAVTFGQDGIPVVVDTASSGGKVVARQVVEGRVREIPDPDRPGLVFPVAWTTERGSALFGRVCPDPMLDDLSMLDAPTDGGCGTDVHRFSLRLLDAVAATWSEVELDVPLLSGQDLAVLGADGSSVLVRGGDREVPDTPALFVVDLGSGAVSDLGPAPDDVAPTWCGAEGSFLGTTLPDQTGTGDGPPTETVEVRAGRISRTPSGAGPLLPIGCVGGTMLAVEPSGPGLHRIVGRDEGGGSTPVPLPPGLDVPARRRIDVGRRQPNQAPLIWESRDGSFQLWELDREVWSKVGSPRPGGDPPTVAAVGWGRAFAFVTSDSSTTLVEI